MRIDKVARKQTEGADQLTVTIQFFRRDFESKEEWFKTLVQIEEIWEAMD